MTKMRCPTCSEVMAQEPYIINGESIMFWVCPEGDWEEPVDQNSSAGDETTAEYS